jgi:hypothetical protein
MSLIKCPECKGLVSNTAKTCPHCGAKVKKGSGCGTFIGAIFLGLFVLVGIAYQIGKNNKSSTSTVSRDAIAQAIQSSDDFSTYEIVFITASQQLVSTGVCNLADFKEIGGWVKSANHKSQPIYFTYCGGLPNPTTNNRIYLNVRTGEIFR